MIGLGIESTCDETSLGVVKDGRRILSLKLYSQIELHKKFNGVVPEIASRVHLEKINFLFDAVKNDSQINTEDFDYVAVSTNPGLIGAIMIGAQFARCLSFIFNLPIIAVNHLEAHLNAITLEEKIISFPYIGVLLSGGNSSIFLVEDYGKLQLIGDTTDDALGEAFDKVAILLKLGYPGGPLVENIARKYSPIKSEKPLFPRLLKEKASSIISFSYSGLKTSVLRFLQQRNEKDVDLSKVCYYFQETAFELVERNIKKAVKLTGVKNIVIGGGVIANQTLRNRLNNFAIKQKLHLQYPKNKLLCTDNGAMVASLGYYLAQKGKASDLEFKLGSTSTFPFYNKKED